MHRIVFNILKYYLFDVWVIAPPPV